MQNARAEYSGEFSMSLDSDVIVDRRRIRRKLTFWRVTAALVAIAAVAIVGVVVTPGGRGALTTSGSIARVNIEGLIRSDQERVEALERLENSKAAAVVVHINSPGGTTAGSEQLYDALVRLKAKKLLVVVVEGLAASGGYITAIAADHIVAQQSSLVGSIGVLFQYPNFTDLMKTVGVKVEEVKSSPLKAAPNGFEPTSPEARAALDALVKDSYAWFRGLVKERRGMDDALLEKVADGRVFTGRQAVDLKLIDQLGDEKTAIAWLVAQKNGKSDLPVRDYKLAPRFGCLTFLRTAASITPDALGLSVIARHVEQAGVVQAVDRLGLDGVLALWRPAGAGWNALIGFPSLPPALRVASQSRFRPFVTRFRVAQISFSVLTVQGIFTEMDIPKSRVPVSMIKSELVQRIAEHNPHLYQRDVENIVNAILDEIVAALARGDRVELRGFGAFSVKHRPARAGRNPRTGAHVPVDQKSVPFFKTGKEMRERLNREGGGPGAGT